MYIMKNFRDIRNILNEFVETPRDIPGGGGGGDDDHSMRMRLMTAMNRIPFEYKTSDGHEVKFNSSTDAMVTVGKHVAHHDHAFAHHFGENQQSPMSKYHEAAGDAHSEIYEALRKHIQNHKGISPHFRSYTDNLFNHNTFYSDGMAGRDGRRIENWSKSHEEHQQPFADLQRHLQNPEKGYFVHKDEME